MSKLLAEGTYRQFSMQNWKDRTVRSVIVGLATVSAFGMPQTVQEGAGLGFAMLTAAWTGKSSGARPAAQ